jgi:3-oxoacyl-[acyl-carrier protein] reductase
MINNLKPALVVGGTGGIGKAVVRRLSANGIEVYATYHRDEAGARELGEALGNGRLVQCDLRSRESVDRAIGRVLTLAPALSTIVYCVTAPLKLRPFDALRIEDFEEDLDVILMGAVKVLSKVTPLLSKQGGTIILLLSTVVVDPPAPRLSSYAVAKYGLLGLLKSLAVELKNVRVIGVSPYYVETPLLEAFPKKLLEIEREKAVGGTFLSPEDVADLIGSVLNGDVHCANGSNLVIRNKEDIMRIKNG